MEKNVSGNTFLECAAAFLYMVDNLSQVDYAWSV